MSALRTTCHRAVGTELSLVNVGNMEDLLDQISNLQHQVSSLQQEMNRLSELRGLSGSVGIKLHSAGSSLIYSGITGT